MFPVALDGSQVGRCFERKSFFVKGNAVELRSSKWSVIIESLNVFIALDDEILCRRPSIKRRKEVILSRYYSDPFYTASRCSKLAEHE